MMRFVFLIFAFLLAACPPLPESERRSPFEEVDVFIGTGGTGFGAGSCYPGAALPFGLVKLSPDTQGGLFGRETFAHFAGYFYGDTHIEGFSHTHVHGTGAIDYGNVTFMPTLGMTAEKTSWRGYSAPFTHGAEVGEPGYYAVDLGVSDPADEEQRAQAIRAELSATLRTGAHRYTFPPGADAVVVVDLGHTLSSGEVDWSQIEILPGEKRLRGSLHQRNAFSGRFGGVTIYMDAVFSRPFRKYGVWSATTDGGALQDRGINARADGSGGSTGAYLHFDPSAPVEVFVGISFTSARDAEANRSVETAGRTFDDIREAARTVWETRLDQIEVEGGTPDQREIFYTALYHALQMPSLYSDVNGRHRAFDGSIAADAGSEFYSDMSLWDTYRTLHPLLTWLTPSYQRDFVRSLVEMGRARGSLPRWPFAHRDGASMIGTPADIVIADSYLKGIRDFDWQRAYALMVSTAVWGDPYNMRRCVDDYNTLGHCTADNTNGSVSVTQENMWADFAISRFAQAIGKEEDALFFADRADAFDTLWDAENGFFRAKKRDGSWALPALDPLNHTDDYTEGNAWQYLWLVPWNVEKLATLLGGVDAALAKLDHFFTKSQETPKPYLGDIRMPDNYYWHGNEPDLHAPYLYAMWGEPKRGAPVIRWVMESRYGTGPDGLDGNDDGGTLSAWYIFSALGFYPIPATTRYWIGTPIFEKAVIRLENGRTLTIRAPGTSEKNIYVGAVYVDGKRINRHYLEHEELTTSREIVFEMTSRAN